MLEKLKGAAMPSQYCQETKHKFFKNRFNILLRKTDVDNQSGSKH